jgi:hypothetical protein
MREKRPADLNSTSSARNASGAVLSSDLVLHSNAGHSAPRVSELLKARDAASPALGATSTMAAQQQEHRDVIALPKLRRAP